MKKIHNIEKEEDLNNIIENVKQMNTDPFFLKILSLYSLDEDAVDIISMLILDLIEKKRNVLELLKEMYAKYPPFRNSIENKVNFLNFYFI